MIRTGHIPFPLSDKSRGAILGGFPASIQSKLAFWAKDETDDYITDQLGEQEREALTQNSQEGQVFPGRGIAYNGTDQYSYIPDDAGSMDVGNDPIVFSLWVYLPTLGTGVYSTRPIIGKSSSITDGNYALAVHNNSLRAWFVDSEGALKSVTTALGVSVTTWMHVVFGIDGDGKIFIFIDADEKGSRAQMNGTFSAALSNCHFGFASGFSQSNGNANQWNDVSIRQVFMYRDTVVSQALVDSLYNDELVPGFTNYWPCAGSGTTEHSAIEGGDHLTNVAFTGGSRITGDYYQAYNDYGYAENATYGQIPPDLGNLVAGKAINDCLGNALVFRGSAKLHLELVDASTFKMPTGFTSARINAIRDGCAMVGFNIWYSGLVAQNITIANVKEYYGNRQFYNSTDKELIIIKEGEHLNVSEEAYLTAYVAATIPTDYHANTTTLLAKFTNSYTDAEKSKIDNLMRLMVAGSVYGHDLFYNAAIGAPEEDYLNWMSASYDLTITNTEAGSLPKKGLYSQTGYHVTGFTPTTHAVNLTQNDASMAFKLAIDIKAPGEHSLYNAEGGGGKIGAYFQRNTAKWQLIAFLNNTFLASFNIGTEDLAVDKSFLVTRTNTTIKLIHNGTIYSNEGGPSTSVVLPNVELKAGNSSIPEQNYLQMFSLGEYLSDADGLLYTRILDNYGDGQLAQADEWIEKTGYKYKLNDKLILDRIGDNILWSDGFKMYYSTDDGATVDASIAFDTVTNGYPVMCCMFDNGKIIFATFGNNVYKTTTALTSITAADFLDVDDSPYTVHTPSNVINPGEYTRFLGIQKKQYLPDGTQILMWNNYCNNLTGAAPVLVLRSLGDDIKVMYEFGQNPYFRDDGTNDGGSTGTLLGDSGNSNKTRHGHGLQQNPDNKLEFISMWGDLDRADPFNECKVMKHTYNQGTDACVTALIKEDLSTTRFKMTAGQMPGDGYFYFSSDTADDWSPDDEQGYFKCLIADIADDTKHTRFYTQLEERPANHFLLDTDGLFIGGGYAAGGAGGGGGGFFGSPNILYGSSIASLTEVVLDIPGNVYIYKITKIGPKKYQLDMMADYFFQKNSQCVIIDFN